MKMMIFIVEKSLTRCYFTVDRSTKCHEFKDNYFESVHPRIDFARSRSSSKALSINHYCDVTFGKILSSTHAIKTANYNFLSKELVSDQDPLS